MTSSGEQSPVALTPAGTPSLQSAPKFGTLIPNRIFVGGISGNATETELKQFFGQHGAVKDAKIIMDRAGVSKGYGFVTFESQDEAERIIKKDAENFVFKDRKLNIGPAIKKQSYPRTYGDEPSLSPTNVFYTNGAVPYTYQNGMAMFGSDGSYAAAVPQQYAGLTVLPHQYAVQPSYYHTSPTAATSPTHWTTSTAASSQWRWAPQSPATPTAAASASAQFLYHPSALHHDGTTLMYAQPSMSSAQGASAYQADLPDASIMDAAAPAEGSFTMDTQAHSPYAENRSHPRRTSFDAKSSAQRYSPPRFMSMTPANTPRSKAMYTNGATPRMMTKTINGTPIKVICRETADQEPCGPLTPPPTPHAESTS